MFRFIIILQITPLRTVPQIENHVTQLR